MSNFVFDQCSDEMFLNPNISSGESEVIIQDHKIATAATSHEIIRTLNKRGATIGQILL